MINIGGEVELKPLNYNQAMTNSGRSSLRLILESAGLRGKRILLPDFFCQVIVDVLQEFKITYVTYKVDSKFSFYLPSNVEEFDALYLIKYFGNKTQSFTQACSLFSGCLIVDDVFSPFPEVFNRERQWYSFNSLRKISAISDFSLVYSNSLIAPLVIGELQSFSRMKYKAKYEKYNFINCAIGFEEEYLDSFNSAEKILDSNIGIYQPSVDSITAVMHFYSKIENERIVRQNNYDQVKSMLPGYLIEIQSDFVSFAPLMLKNRDEVRARLMKEKIFLAVHWPSADSIRNKLSDYIISIPLDSRYVSSDIGRVCDLILTLEGS